MNKALLIVDLQKDFCEGGALAVNGANAIVPVINKLIPEFPIVVASRDWHPSDHCSFKENGGPWPVHCVRGSEGAKFHDELQLAHENKWVNIFKGLETERDSYSAFFDNDHVTQTNLNQILKEEALDTLFVCGLATDYCVKFTVLDALKLGYKVYLVVDAVRGVNVSGDDSANAVEEMEDAGAVIITSDDAIKQAKNRFVDSYKL